MQREVNKSLQDRTQERAARSPSLRALLLIILSLALGGATIVSLRAFAQSGRGGGYNSRAQRRFRNLTIDERVERIGKRLDLNDTQRVCLREILESQQAQVDRLWNDQQLAPADRRAKLRMVQEETERRFHALLTGEQAKKCDNFVQRMLFRTSQVRQKSETNAH